MSTLAAAQALAEGLDFDALSVKYNDLQILYETSEKQQEALRNEIQRVRSELQAALARASEQELQKQNVIIQYETSTLNERKLSDQLATIASDLTSFKGKKRKQASFIFF
ncbi:hypothetical protein BDA99DRAFT_518108 [Phascolomyces articulosus]|uniref:Uncharacterized protein n=1 Tax=Phascolomyces articulosus TaxID=60185 RepID=A0AAD5PBI1_9FUNG|nr:hypothetical protein BDA99DRAFT_518108 [Phascolomyces articulosus]